MEIKHRKNTHKGSFYIEENNIILAEMTYSFAGADKNISIVPLCPFAKKVIEKAPAYRDVLLK